MLRKMAMGGMVLACMGGVAHAQTSSVTLYGIADVGVFHDRVKTAGETTRTTVPALSEDAKVADIALLRLLLQMRVF